MSSHWNERMYPWDDATPRFYPPGQHPALTRMYAWVAEVERVLESLRRREIELGVTLEKDGAEEALRWGREQIAMYEERESELKAEAALRRDRR